eukprot:4894458-Pleurochrysis_carterae.AAC.1
MSAMRSMLFLCAAAAAAAAVVRADVAFTQAARIGIAARVSTLRHAAPRAALHVAPRVIARSERSRAGVVQCGWGPDPVWSKMQVRSACLFNGLSEACGRQDCSAWQHQSKKIAGLHPHAIDFAGQDFKQTTLSLRERFSTMANVCAGGRERASSS